LGWLSGWSYRKSHKITGSTAGAVSNYQIPITVHYGSGSDSGGDVYLNGKCRSDFGDIRFTDSDGVTLLPYWVEEKVDSNYAKVWVKVPYITASPGQATIYLYYGNPSATSASNGNDTFVLFDDFDTLDTSKWDVNTANGGSVVVSNGALVLTSRSNYANGAGVISKNPLPSGDYALEASVKRTVGHQRGEPGLLVGLTNKYARDSNYGIWYCVNNYNYPCGSAHLFTNLNTSPVSRFYVTYYDGAATTVAADYMNYLVRLTAKVNISSFRTEARFIYGSNDVSFYATGTAGISPLYVQIHYGEYGNSGYSSYCYWIAVRKLVDPEPVNDVWGSEEILRNVDDKGLDYVDEFISLLIHTQFNVDDKGLVYDDESVALPPYTQLNVDDKGLDYGDAVISLTPPTLNIDAFGLSYVDKTIAVKPVAAAFDLSWLILLIIVAALVTSTTVAVKKYKQLYNPYMRG
jgi:hypothetical protein